MKRIISIDGVGHNPGIYGTATKGVCRDWIFSAGEHGIQFYTDEKQEDFMKDLDAPIFLNLRNGDGRAIMETLNANDALRRMGYKDIRLIMAYIPYSRQDRATTPGTAFSLKMFADVINTGKFDEVIVIDPHSKVAAPLIHNVRVIPSSAAMEFFPKNQLQGPVKNLVIVAPDKGAVERATECAAALGVSSERLIYATKERDPTNGFLKTTGVSGFEWQPEDELLFIDDICDGGATFIELAKYLKDQGLKRMPSLYVTHGIFSKSVEELSRYFYTIVSTNSFYRQDMTDGESGKPHRHIPDGSLIPIELILEPYFTAVSVGELKRLHAAQP